MLDINSIYYIEQRILKSDWLAAMPEHWIRSGANTPFCLMKLSKMESINDETNNYFVNDQGLQIMGVGSIQILKRGNKKCRKKEVYSLLND